jgi:uncharacterized protein YaiE (UPF0345 family)
MDQIKHNVYFDGNVQSLGLATAKGKATVGVMKKGAYQFSTSSAEVMVIITGQLSVSFNGVDFKDFNENEKFEVEANASFDVRCEDDVAYICYYESSGV